MKELQQFMNDSDQWANSTFGKIKALSVSHHLKKEVNELVESLENKQENTGEEIFDCFILLCRVASTYGVDAEELLDGARNKLEVCKKRKWSKPDENGVIEHVRD